MTATRGPTGPFLGLALLAGVLLSCQGAAPSSRSGPPPAAESPTGSARSTSAPGTSTPTPPPDPSAGAPGCITIAVMSSAAPPTTEWMREVEVIAPGTIDQVDPAEWNTPGNVRPDLDAVQHGRSSAIIWRPVRLTLDAPWKGTTDGATKAVVRGRTVGCDSYLFDDDPLLVPGDRYVLFLYEVTDSTGRPPGVMSVIDAWPIHADGTVERPVEVPIALDDLRKLFATPAR